MRIQIGRKEVPALLLASLLIVSAAGAATGIVTSGGVSGTFVTGVDQSILIAPEGIGVTLKPGVEGTTVVSDDLTTFRVAAGIHQGDKYEVRIDLKHVGEAATAGRLTLEFEETLQIEVQSGAVTNFEVQRLDKHTWMFHAEADIGAPLTTTNPWTDPFAGVPNPVSFIDAGSGTWNPKDEDDIIIADSGGLGTVSDSADTVINDEGNPDRDNRDDLLSLNDTALFFDKDEDGNYTTGDEVFLDDDDDGVYSKNDTIIAGTPPSDGTSVSSGNNSDWILDSFDGTNGNNWTASEDFIGNDSDEDGVYTSGPDTVINDEGSQTRDVGNTLLTPGSTARFYDKDGSSDYSGGDEVFLDDDGDGNYTNQRDDLLDADGSGTTGIGSQSSSTGDTLVRFEASDNVTFDGDLTGTYDLWLDSNGNDTYDSGELVIFDDDSSLTDGLVGTGAETEPLLKYVDEGSTGAYTAGDDVFLDIGGNGTVSGGADQIVSRGDDTSVDASNGVELLDFDKATFKIVDDNGNGVIDYGTEDDIVRDDGGSGTFSDAVDTFVGGTPPSDGTPYTVIDGFDPDWGLVKWFDDSPGDPWDPTSDIIVVDHHDGGTYSGGDTVVSRGDDTVLDVTDGNPDSSNDFNESTFFVVDDDDDGSIDFGVEDDIVTDDDEDDRYTAHADVHLAGVSLSTLNSDPVTTTNPWASPPAPDPPVTFFDDSDGVWDASTDSIYLDVSDDRIVSYNEEDDMLLAGTEYGDLVIVIALPDDASPGFYTVKGQLKPTEV